MGISLINNQPIIFNNTTTPCGCPELDFKQPIDQTDVTKFQFNLYPCPNSPQLINNSDFDTTDEWQLISGFSISNSLAIKSAGATGQMNYLNVTTPGSLFQMEISVKKLQGTLKVASFIPTVQEINSAGVHKFNFAANDFHLRFAMDDADSYAEIDYITLYAISPNLAWGIIDDTGTTVHVSAYQDSPSSFCFSGTHATISINWSTLELADGCYTIGVTDPCANECGQNGVPNGDFNSGSALWTETINVGAPVSTFANGVLSVTGTTADQVDFTHSDITLCSKTYNVTVVINKLNNASVTVEMGSGSALFNSAGTSTQQIVSDSTTLVMNVLCSGLNASIYIESIEISLVNESDYSFTYESVGVKLGTYTDDCDILKVSICNNDDAWGFAFEEGCFLPAIRVPAGMMVTGYPGEREMNEFNNGTRQVQWAERRKLRQFATDPLPEYVLDFLSLIPHADHVFIGETEYIGEDDEVTLNVIQDRKNEATLVVNLMETTSIYNVNNGNVSNGCDPGGTILGSSSDVIIVEGGTEDRVGKS